MVILLAHRRVAPPLRRVVRFYDYVTATRATVSDPRWKLMTIVIRAGGGEEEEEEEKEEETRVEINDLKPGPKGRYDSRLTSIKAVRFPYRGN